jgi:Flp pilus assembly protein TadG
MSVAFAAMTLTHSTHSKRSVLRSQRGQALIETGMAAALFVTMAIGILEAGRAFMVVGMISNAARDAARTAAAAGPSNRDASGNITASTKTAIQSTVVSQIAKVDSATTISSVVVTQTTISGLPSVQVTVNGTVPLIFHLLGTSIPVNRVVTFRDEGK